MPRRIITIKNRILFEPTLIRNSQTDIALNVFQECQFYVKQHPTETVWISCVDSDDLHQIEN